MDKLILPCYEAEQSTGILDARLKLDAGFYQNEYLIFDVETHCQHDPLIRLQWLSCESSDPILIMSCRLVRNCRLQVRIPISADTFLLKHTYINPRAGMRKARMKGTPTKKALVDQLLFVLQGEAGDSIQIHNAAFVMAPESVPAVGEPVLDAFGQSLLCQWENKVHSEEELVSYLKDAYQQALVENQYPEDWSAYGGWLKKKLTATGYFHLEHDGRRQWLVDPDGYVFFSNGICYGNRCGLLGYTDGLEQLHQWLPEKDGEFADAWATADNVPQYSARNGSADAAQRYLFNFSRANLIRAFGSNWHESWTTITAARLKTWGFNTIGVGTNDYLNERTQEFLEKAKIPFVVTFPYFPKTEHMVFRDFPDVFSQEYQDRCSAFAEDVLTPYLGNPYLVGYFVTNEPRWLAHRQVNLCERLMASPLPLASKTVFVKTLEEKYKTVAALNAAWNTTFASFQDLYTPMDRMDALSSESETDCLEFHRAMVELYGKCVSAALRAVDPHHLNLGMRYSHMSEKTLGCALDYFDVFSVNSYKPAPVEDAVQITKHTNAPILIGEWHIGAKESGLPMQGLCFTDTQAQRAQACAYYAEHAAESPHIVGIHYFEYNDQPYFGRFDGECYNIGLCDVCHKPYKLLTDAFTDFANKLYPLADGQITASSTPVPLQVRENI